MVTHAFSFSACAARAAICVRKGSGDRIDSVQVLVAEEGPAGHRWTSAAVLSLLVLRSPEGNRFVNIIRIQCGGKVGIVYVTSHI